MISNSPNAMLVQVQRMMLILWGVFLISGIGVGFIFPGIPFGPPVAMVLAVLALGCAAISFLVPRLIVRSLKAKSLQADSIELQQAFRSIVPVGLILRLALNQAALMLGLFAVSGQGPGWRIGVLVLYVGLLVVLLPSLKSLETVWLRVTVRDIAT